MSWVCVVFPLFSARIGNHQSVNLQSWWVVLTSGCPSGSERINGTAVWGFANLLLTQPWWQGMCFLIYNQRQLYMHIIIIKCVCVHVRDIMTLNTTLLWHSIQNKSTTQNNLQPDLFTFISDQPCTAAVHHLFYYRYMRQIWGTRNIIFVLTLESQVMPPLWCAQLGIQYSIMHRRK